MYLILHEKHGTSVVEGRNFNEAALKVVTDRFNDGYWYENWDEGDPNTQWADRAAEIVKDQNPRLAGEFLAERDDHEYEGFTVQ